MSHYNMVEGVSVFLARNIVVSGVAFVQDCDEERRDMRDTLGLIKEITLGPGPFLILYRSILFYGRDRLRRLSSKARPPMVVPRACATPSLGSSQTKWAYVACPPVRD